METSHGSHRVFRMIPDSHLDTAETAAIGAGRQIVGKNIVESIGLQSPAKRFAEVVGVTKPFAAGFFRNCMQPILLFALSHVYPGFQGSHFGRITRRIVVARLSRAFIGRRAWRGWIPVCTDCWRPLKTLSLYGIDSHTGSHRSADDRLKLISLNRSNAVV